jgi:hypothetical protein
VGRQHHACLISAFSLNGLEDFCVLIVSRINARLLGKVQPSDDADVVRLRRLACVVDAPTWMS